ncbi:SPOR domain-containing protein [Bacteroidota bacterium]
MKSVHTMEKHLTSLLEKNNRVIVPDLGAFIIRQQEPRELVFNDLLAFDDGLLTDQIMQEENKSKAEARDEISKYVENVKKILEDGKAYQLKNIGSLLMDSSGKIEYSTSVAGKDSIPEDVPVEEPESAEPAETEPEDVPVEKPEIAEPAETEPEDVPVEEPEIAEPSEQDKDLDGFTLTDGDADVDVDATSEETPLKADREEPPFSLEETEEAETETETEAEAETETEAEPVVEPVAEPEIVSESEGGADTEPAEEEVEETAVVAEPDFQPEPEPIRAESPFSTYTQPKKTRKKAWPWIVGSATVVLLLLAAAWFMFPETFSNILHKEVSEVVVTEQFAEGEEDAETPAVQEPDVSSELPADDVKEKEIKSPEPEPVVEPQEKQYYVVAGCFAELKNAENYVSTLRAQGYDASIFGMHKNLHAVCFNAHSSKQAAIEELRRIRDTYDPNVWVLFH